MQVELLEREARTNEIEECACLLCGSKRRESVARSTVDGITFHVVQCTDCGFHYTNPRPTLRSIGHFYPNHYRPHSGVAHYLRPLRSWYPLDWLQLPSSGHRPRLLDFGCGGGHFLAAMDRAGWEVAGLDVSAAAVAAIREEIGLATFVGTLPHEVFEPASFDCITMWHSLEHVHDPLRIVREARRLLRADGRLIIAVPNFASWSRRSFGNDWFGLDLPRHLAHFDCQSLTRLLETSGMRVNEMRYARHGDWIRASAQRRNRGMGDWLLQSRRIAAMFARFARTEDGDALVVLAEPNSQI